MKLVLKKENFLHGLQIVQNLINTRTTLPVLSNCLLKTMDGKISLSTTDLDTGIRAEVESKVDKPGGITLPARRLFNIVKELPAEEITLDVDSKLNASIRAGASFFKIKGLLGIFVMLACIILGAAGYRAESKKLKSAKEIPEK